MDHHTVQGSTYLSLLTLQFGKVDGTAASDPRVFDPLVTLLVKEGGTNIGQCSQVTNTGVQLLSRCLKWNGTSTYRDRLPVPIMCNNWPNTWASGSIDIGYACVPVLATISVT